MSITSDPNLWVIGALIFLLGLLIGMFLTSGGRRKWKHRYKDEAERHQALQRKHDEHRRETEEREREWRERDSLRGAAIKDNERDERPL